MKAAAVANTGPAPRPMKRARGSIARCPHCESPAFIRTSEEVTILHRDLWLYCTNPECGHSWKASLSFVHTVSLPSRPKAGLDLPISEPRYRERRRNGDPP